MAKVNLLKLLLRCVLALLPVVKKTLLDNKDADDTNLDEIIDSVITILEQFVNII